MIDESLLQDAPDSFRDNIKEVLDEYPLGPVHGFQKDAVQNAVGARKDGNSFKGWKCLIYIQKTDKGTFLIVEDFGTTGLTGVNYNRSDLLKAITNGSLTEDDKLARFESQHNSGGHVGPGLYGVGKYVYSYASNDNKCLFFFDSKTEDYGYRSNVCHLGKYLYPAKVGAEAAALIQSETGLVPIDHVGTRIIIADPKQEYIDEINNGDMLNFVSQTWWPVIVKCQADEGVFVNGIRAEKPAMFGKDFPALHSYFIDNGYRIREDRTIRKFGFIILKDQIVDENLRGIYFYRLGMQIYPIKLDYEPEAIKGKYLGFVEVDGKWEEKMKEIENLTHYRVKDRRTVPEPLLTLRGFVKDQVNRLLREWNYLPKENATSRFNEDYEQAIKTEIADLLADSGFTPIGEGEEPDRVTLRLSDVKYPHPEEDRTVYDNDGISFKFTIKNVNSLAENFVFRVSSVCPETKEAPKQTVEKEIKVAHGLEYFDQFSFHVTPETAEKNCQNTLVISVLLKGGKKPLATRKIVFYYAKPTQKDLKTDFEFIRSSCTMPKIASRRVNTDEQITDLTYKLTNNTNQTLNFVINVTARNAADHTIPLPKLARYKMTIGPNSFAITPSLNIVFSKDPYSILVKKGIIEIRAKASIDGEQGIYKPADTVGHYDFSIFFNADNKNGMSDMFDFGCDSVVERHERSWLEETGGGRYKILVNVGFPEYLALEDKKLQDDYIIKETVFQTIQIYLRSGHLENFDFSNTEGDKDDPKAVVTAFKTLLDGLWWKKCQK